MNRIRLGKKGVMGEGILMIYRLMLISFIALVVLGVAAVFYDYYVDVRDVEARIMAVNVVNCLSPNGMFIANNFEGYENKILEYCGIYNSGRFYINVSVSGKKYKDGDSGLLWIREMYVNTAGESVKKYEPGYFSEVYPVIVDGQDEKLNIEVLVNHEF